MDKEQIEVQPAPWICPTCHDRLELKSGGTCWVCLEGHAFDVAREGYVNLLVTGQRRTRQFGDTTEMVRARRRFLATGAFDPLTAFLSEAVEREHPAIVLDVGCGEGRHTRSISAPAVLGIDAAKAAIAAASRAHPDGWYAAANAFQLPVPDEVVDVALDVFGPIVPAELARVVRPGGTVVTAHPGSQHLEAVRRLVRADLRPHQIKPPLRGASRWFVETSSTSIRFPVTVNNAMQLFDLFAMTPYYLHAPSDIHQRIAAASVQTLKTLADVHVTSYRRLSKDQGEG